MTIVRIAHAEPRPGRMPDGSVLIGQHLIVLADDAAGRALPLWLQVPGGDSLWRLLDRPAGDAAMAGVLEETATRLLHAAGARVTAVDIEPAGADVHELRSGTVTARVGLATADGTRHVTVSAGYGLALAAAAGAPVRVADDVMGRLAVPVQGGDLLAPFLPPAAAWPLSRPGRPRWRFEPRNLAFTDGLDRWELAGSFLDASQPHLQDYSCTAAGRSAVLASVVPEPSGFAVLVQTIFADDYRGAAVTFRGDLRATDVADRAGLVLRVIGEERLTPPQPAGYDPRRDPGNHLDPVTGTCDWTRHEITAHIPPGAAIISFGIFLTGCGQIELRTPELGQHPANQQQQPGKSQKH